MCQNTVFEASYTFRRRSVRAMRDFEKVGKKIKSLTIVIFHSFTRQVGLTCRHVTWGDRWGWRPNYLRSDGQLSHQWFLGYEWSKYKRFPIGSWYGSYNISTAVSKWLQQHMTAELSLQQVYLYVVAMTHLCSVARYVSFNSQPYFWLSRSSIPQRRNVRRSPCKSVILKLIQSGVREVRSSARDNVWTSTAGAAIWRRRRSEKSPLAAGQQLRVTGYLI